MAIELNNITKQYKEVAALREVSLTLEEHKIYGLLGRNGAGKTTMLNVITNRLFPSEGTVSINGEPALENDHALGNISFMTEKNFYPDDTKISSLFRWEKMFFPAFDSAYADTLCEKFGLPRKGKFKELSTGYASICKLILTMASGAPYLFFDEPVLGLDANHRDLFYRELLALYSEKPCTIVISTHLIEEVSDVIEQVVILKAGSLLMNCPVEEMLQTGYTVSGKANDIDRFCTGKNILGTDTLGGLKTACIYDTSKTRPEIPPELELGALDLQKLFIQLTNA